ncbi:membrane protein [Magnetospirillum fulvum MGU-K5]|uniref:Membrane protein n=2 Tax=Magnetospirillum fulvum TaxID=1082 RepID=S9TDD5_MAGFU|nr:membrane protein [Magnetospirillum fulvum MGU-K5]
MALAAEGEKAAAKVIQAASAIARAGSAMQLQNYLYAAILVLPYLLLVVAYSTQVVVAIFRATMVGVFAPFLFMAFAFGWGRGMAQSGAKTLLASILVLFASTAALSLTVFGVRESILNPADLTGDRINEFASITNPEFLVVMFLGWMGTALLTEGTSIANSIAGTMLTNTASGIMTAGISGSAIAAGTLGKRAGIAGTLAAKDAAGGWGALGLLPIKGMAAVTGPVAASAAALVEKFQNINKPDSKA